MRSVTFVTGLADTKTPYIIPCIAPERVCWAVIGPGLADLCSDWLSRVRCGHNQHNFHPAGDQPGIWAASSGEGAVTRNMTQGTRGEAMTTPTPVSGITMQNITFLSRSHTIVRTVQAQPGLIPTQDCSEILRLSQTQIFSASLCKHTISI